MSRVATPPTVRNDSAISQEELRQARQLIEQERARRRRLSAPVPRLDRPQFNEQLIGRLNETALNPPQIRSTLEILAERGTPLRLPRSAQLKLLQEHAAVLNDRQFGDPRLLIDAVQEDRLRQQSVADIGVRERGFEEGRLQEVGSSLRNERSLLELRRRIQESVREAIQDSETTPEIEELSTQLKKHFTSREIEDALDRKGAFASQAIKASTGAVDALNRTRDFIRDDPSLRRALLEQVRFGKRQTTSRAQLFQRDAKRLREAATASEAESLLLDSMVKGTSLIQLVGLMRIANRKFPAEKPANVISGQLQELLVTDDRRNTQGSSAELTIPERRRQRQ